MTNKKQEAVDTLWAKYKKILEMLNDALDELEKKPKEVEVIKEIEANIDLSTPLEIAELEKKIEDRLNKDDKQQV
jgi:hypothetical protein